MEDQAKYYTASEREAILTHPLRLHFQNYDDERFIVNFDSLMKLASHKLKGNTKPKKHDEESIQIHANKLWRTKYPRIWRCLFMIKNDGHKNGKKIITKNGKEISLQAIRDKSMGLLSGVADCYLSIPNRYFHGMYIEFKTPAGKQSENQIKFQGMCQVLNYKYVLIRSVTEFDVVVNDYMSTTDPKMIELLEQYHSEIDKLKGIDYDESI